MISKQQADTRGIKFLFSALEIMLLLKYIFVENQIKTIQWKKWIKRKKKFVWKFLFSFSFEFFFHCSGHWLNRKKTRGKVFYLLNEKRDINFGRNVYNWILVTKKASIRLILCLLDQEDEEIELFSWKTSEKNTLGWNWFIN